ncbi:MAG TPA: DciA family protein [Caulobacteraceae bacterium]|nr:DciA family protein [Caulobacteraceae bacterium]
MPRALPSAAEAAEILSRKRTRPARRPPRAAGARLSGFVRSLDERFGKGPDTLKARWREIVGETLARHTEPAKLSRPRKGAAAVLELKVEGPAAALIQHQAPEILARVNLFLGAGAVERLRVVQGLVRHAPAPKALRRRRPGPLDAAKEAELAAGVACARDEDLKAALIRLGRGVLRRESETQP